jgi:hypothetical protein
MGQKGSEKRDLYVQMLKAMLKTRKKQGQVTSAYAVFRFCAAYLPVVP